MAHASFSVNEQRGIAMNLRFEEEKKHEQRMQFLKGAIRFSIMAAAVVFLAWLIITFALKKVSVIGSSMETTLYNGEDVIVNKTSYVLFPPKRNQIIAFYPEVQDEEETINSDSMIHIRRVAGLPGEKVQIKNGKLYINGEEQKEKYDFEAMHSGGRAVNEITLKDDEYFVLSDSRNDMDDSRNSSFTKVTKKNIIGKVILRPRLKGKYGLSFPRKTVSDCLVNRRRKLDEFSMVSGAYDKSKTCHAGRYQTN